MTTTNDRPTDVEAIRARHAAFPWPVPTNVLFTPTDAAQAHADRGALLAVVDAERARADQERARADAAEARLATATDRSLGQTADAAERERDTALAALAKVSVRVDDAGNAYRNGMCLHVAKSANLTTGEWSCLGCGAKSGNAAQKEPAPAPPPHDNPWATGPSVMLVGDREAPAPLPPCPVDEAMLAQWRRGEHWTGMDGLVRPVHMRGVVVMLAWLADCEMARRGGR